jgi:hypothetical protein
LDREDAKVFAERYAIVVAKKGWFGKLWDKLCGAQDDSASMLMVKRCAVVGLEHKEDNEDKDAEHNEVGEKCEG